MDIHILKTLFFFFFFFFFPVLRFFTMQALDSVMGCALALEQRLAKNVFIV